MDRFGREWQGAPIGRWLVAGAVHKIPHQGPCSGGLPVAIGTVSIDEGEPARMTIAITESCKHEQEGDTAFAGV